MSTPLVEELLRLLCCGELTPEELAEATEWVQGAPDDPEFDWIEDPDRARLFAICETLSGCIAEGVEVDDLHRQIALLFADPLPAWPVEGAAPVQDTAAYLRWLDAVMGERGVDQGGYGLILADPGIDDDLRILMVYRPDIPRILQIAEICSLTLERPAAVFGPTAR